MMMKEVKDERAETAMKRIYLSMEESNKTDIGGYEKTTQVS